VGKEGNTFKEDNQKLLSNWKMESWKQTSRWLWSSNKWCVCNWNMAANNRNAVWDEYI